ncbi:wall-associated receptor kinase 3-like [Phalaenopsis equestris]|uniref:wall-associated receptor kinase 3-like n=1 Tax=Phalaenopsis equestris TaxID=78828 RepID=UPI0009E2E1B6|nr:wall-associated receptor kinase 3-like [Phalaenopsis equestris]
MSPTRRLLFLLLAFSSLHTPCSSSPPPLSPLVLASENGGLCNGTLIPFPFGISELTTYPSATLFNITCKHDNGDLTSPPRLSISNSFVSAKLPLLEISLTEGFVRIELGPFSWRCDRGFDEVPTKLPYLLQDSPFTFSSTRNVLTVIGCDAMVSLRPLRSNDTRSCVSFCESTDSVVDGICSGVGCCQASIPEKLKSFDLDFESIRNMTGSILNNTPCGRAFILEQKVFKFSVEDLNSAGGRTSPTSVVLDWSIGNKSCEEAKRVGGDYYICTEKAECNDARNGDGYLCRCIDGYDGNPYVRDGCKDIDECVVNGTSPCYGKCRNFDGGYDCSCPFGKTGDGRKQGSGCKRVAPLEIVLAAGLLLLLLLFIGGIISYNKLKNRRSERLKQKHFMQNGGLLLQQHFSVREASAKIFTAGELEMATDKFSESRILGHGGYGTVYKGILSDGREVAIKKSKLMDETQIEQFINEMVILSQTNHRNVVKLLGCCLETQVPLLVYEFISNGTLFNHIHSNGKLKTSPLSWETRLRIAGETAAALAYLHNAASTPVIHRDVKSANILLDEEFTAKVSDFGASRLVPYNQTHVTTVVQGTLGYLDPEYFLTGLLSEKSDVYSFGVVLVELLTTESPLSFRRSDEERSLASYFVRLVKENRILEMVDRRLFQESSMSLCAAAELASRCLNVRGEDRPMMKEVAVELNALRKLFVLSRPPGRLDGEEQNRFLLRPLSICREDGEISMEEKLL